MARKYTGNTDPTTGPTAGILKLVDLFERRYGKKVTNLGTWVNRDMRGKPGSLSVHACGRAADIGYADRTVGVAVWNWLVLNSKALGVEEVHDYVKGRSYRCTRGEGAAGVRPANDLGPGGNWIHVEISPTMAQDASKLEAAWRAIPKP